MRRRKKGIKLNPPTKRIWFLSLILAVLAVAGKFIQIPYVSEYSFWILVASSLLLFLSTLVRGL
ncbi:MAG: hypothetical protein D3910_13110 [Candidatus Electrothrix sp. ATG2]|nr:hypothetical protein [Candidatus Electrothrix sp. ATG2]